MLAKGSTEINIFCPGIEKIYDCEVRGYVHEESKYINPESLFAFKGSRVKLAFKGPVFVVWQLFVFYNRLQTTFVSIFPSS